MASSSPPPSDTGPKDVRREIVLRDIKLDSIVADLPENVFPIDVEVELTRRQGRDNVVLDSDGKPVSPPTYPLPLRSSVNMPYIPSKRVRFTNPVETAEGENEDYEFEHFVRRLTEIRDMAKERDPSAVDRLYIKRLRLCEVPEEWVKDDGRGVDGNAYNEHPQVPIATFEKREKVTQAVREAHGEALSGETTIPLTLANVTIVHLKAYRNAETRRKYFTKGQAENQYNQPQYAPKDLGKPAWDATAKLFEQLAGRGVIGELEYEGRTETDERFIEEDARFVDHCEEDEE